MRVAVEAYESEEYKELSKLRKEATENSTFTIMEGLAANNMLHCIRSRDIKQKSL